MKVVMCIANKKTAPGILSTLKKKQYRVTELASEGGFMKRGNATYLIGVEEENISEVLSLVREFGAKYEQGSSAHRSLAIVLSAEAGAAYLQSSQET